MHTHSADSFQLRQPCAKKFLRFPKHNLGPNERWAADGHDKLRAFGFLFYAFLDDATGKFLDVFVLPDNRSADIVAYCYLDVVDRIGGAFFVQLSTPRQLTRHEKGSRCNSQQIAGLRQQGCSGLSIHSGLIVTP
jgi:hypothetical protein